MGFDWDNAQQVWDKVQEELRELRMNSRRPREGRTRFRRIRGDVRVDQLPRLDVNPDEALERTNRRFIAQFQHLETAVREDGKDLSDMTLKERCIGIAPKRRRT